jgi:hypothetical protein
MLVSDAKGRVLHATMVSECDHGWGQSVTLQCEGGHTTAISRPLCGDT